MRLRAAPRRMVGWFADMRSSKTYRSELGAWYPIAKSLVLAKYPAFLTSDRENYLGVTFAQRAEDNGMDVVLAVSRAARARELFHNRSYATGADDNNRPLPVTEENFVFNESRWKVFVMRVARFLRFVASRRSDAERYANLDDKALGARFEMCESAAGSFMDEARAIELEQKRRALAVEDVELYFEGKPSNRGKP